MNLTTCKKFAPQKLKRFIKKKIYPPTHLNDRVKQKWSIGIYEGNSLDDLRPAQIVSNPVLRGEDVSDLSADFVADPFMVGDDEEGWHMFFELWNKGEGRGEIGAASSTDGYVWNYEGRVLVEPFHLSYPYVFQWEGEHYMIPETYETRTVRLYRATGFPSHWEFEQTLLSGMRFKDASIFRHDDTWWLFVETSPLLKCDTLRLFFAADLTGPWTEHPLSPLIANNPRIARPAGRVVKCNGRIIRFAQACDLVYGRRVHAFEVTALSKNEYREFEITSCASLEGSGRGWNQGGMHHIDVHTLKDGRLLACVDGWLDTRAKRRS